MTTYKRLFLLFAFAFFISSCGNKDVTTYDLTIINNASENLDIYTRSAESNNFSLVDMALADSSTKLFNLNLGVVYTVRLVEEGGDVSSFLYEDDVFSEGSEKSLTFP